MWEHNPIHDSTMVLVTAMQGRTRAYMAAVVLFVSTLILTTACSEWPRSNDCFGGALSSDSIHCEVFEYAHNDGVIEVESVYRVGRALYIYLAQTEPLADAAIEKMLAKSQEVALRTGEHDCVLDPRLCGSGVVSDRLGGYILPESSIYQTIELFPGGAEARRSSPGWQAFEQFWPSSAGGISEATMDNDFDVSEVDRNNFPSLRGKCNYPAIVEPRAYRSCNTWDSYPSLGLASSYADTWNDKAYYYVKAEAGEEEAKVVAAKETLMRSQPDYLTEGRLVVVAVPHDFEELWRWSLVLDRFAESAGNTIGITNARLHFNTLGGLGKDRRYVFPLAYAPDLTDQIKDDHGFPDGLRYRLIIQVETLEFEKTVAGMPQLLKQLEIPESAVGLIYEKEHHQAERGYAEPVPNVLDDLR